MRDMQKKLAQWQSKSKSTGNTKSTSVGKRKQPLKPNDDEEEGASSVAPRRRTLRQRKRSVHSRQLADEGQDASAEVELEDEGDDFDADLDY